MHRSLKQFAIAIQSAAGYGQLLLIAAILVGAISVNGLIRATGGSDAQPIADGDGVLSVEVVRPVPEQVALTFPFNGVIEVQAETPISPEVSGRIQVVSDTFKSGQMVEAGEPLFQLDRADFDLQRRAALGELEAARAALASEEASAQIAKDEWEAVYPNEPIPALAARKPQVQAARARVESAQAAVDTAALSIERTVVSVPEPGRLLDASAAPGQLVSAGETVGRFYAFERIELSFTLPLAVIRQLGPMPGRSLTITGRPDLVAKVDRIDGALDERTRLASVKAKLSDPTKVLPGEFLKGEISGPATGPLLKIPATALLPNDRIWIVVDDTVRIVDVETLHRRDQSVYISQLNYHQGIIPEPPFNLTDGDPVRVAQLNPMRIANNPIDRAGVR